jgi:hypothetical protein
MTGALRLRVALRREDVLHFLGYPEDRQPPARTAARLETVLEEARRLVEARGAYRRLPAERSRDVGLDLVPAEGLVLGVVTAGAALEARASECLRQGDATSALLFDAAGSAAAEEAADRLGAVIVAELSGQDPAQVAREAEQPGAAAPISCRISPGYGRWKLSSQEALFSLLPVTELGVSLAPSFLMVPRKSVSFAMWLGADARPIAGLSGCSRCQLPDCRYRKEPLRA